MKLAETAQRYEEMFLFAKKALESNCDLTSKENRDLFSIACENNTEPLRTAWKDLSAVEKKKIAKNSSLIHNATSYKAFIANEIKKICNQIIYLIDNHILPKTKTNEIQLFFIKMKADHIRFWAECTFGEEKNAFIEEADQLYKEAINKAESLPAVNPIRLGLSLNYSIHLYEIKNDAPAACKCAKKAFDAAITGLDQLDDDQYKDSATIMQLIRDNLTLWEADFKEQPN